MPPETHSEVRAAGSELASCPKCGKALEGSANYCPACGEDLRGLTPTSDTLSVPWAGKVIDGRYRIREKLGEGGMGSVFKVEHVRIGKVLALKVLRPDLLRDKRVRTRFHQEARIVSRLSHPNTIQVFDFGELEDGSLYIAMEYLAGRDLAWTLRAQGPLSEERAAQVGIQVLASLAEAHDLGIIHRDIKPANCMLVKGRRSRSDELVKVLDFGIAKLMEGGSRKHITGVTDFVGTPTYMSPEQASGEELDPRSDLYALGAMLFELVSGRGPFIGPNPMAIVTEHLSPAPAPRLSEVVKEKPISRAFEEVIAQALEKKRDRRFAGAEEMRQALDAAARKLHAVPEASEGPPAEESQELVRRADFDRFERRLRMRRMVAPLAVLLVVSGLGAAGYGVLRRQATRTVVVEREDNDDPSHANRVALGTAVTGHIGAPISDGSSDRDLYEVKVEEEVALTAELSGVPDLNLVLELTHVDAAGKKARVFLDDAPSGEGERVDGVVLGPGRLFARVEERYHFTETPRPPRESSRAEYTLTLRPTEAQAAAGAVEVEPDDSLETATLVRKDEPVTGMTGAAVEWEAAMVMQELSTADFFELKDAPGGVVAAVVVPPAEGKLAALDAAEYEAWRAEMRHAGANPPLPEAVTASGKPVLVPLKAADRRAVRIQPLPPTPAGTSYKVVFVTGRAGGLSAALELARVLDAEGRREDAAGVLRLVASAFAESPQVAEVKAALERQ
ncbi:MAG TPA: serine/threonine-protein kinase [Myxococcales bacterium]|nr:serine/threonine-protein kinase [Myxococcales bacterium]